MKRIVEMRVPGSKAGTGSKATFQVAFILCTLRTMYNCEFVSCHGYGAIRPVMLETNATLSLLHPVATHLVINQSFPDITSVAEVRAEKRH